MIIPMLCVTIFVILVVWFLLPRVARLMIHTPTAISIFVCLSMEQLMAVFRSEERFSRNAETELVCRLLPEKKNVFNDFLPLQTLRRITKLPSRSLAVQDRRPYDLRHRELPGVARP